MEHRQEEIPLQEGVYKTTTSPEMDLKPGNGFLYFAALIANLTAFATGIAFSWTSPVLPKLKITNDDNPIGRPITPNEESWITGCLSLGAIVGQLASGYTAGKFGRKKTLLFISCPMMVSYLMTAFVKTVPLYYTARLLMGFGAGSVFTIVPMYLAEIGEDHNRGTLGCSMGVSNAAGILFAYAVGPYLTIRNFCLVCVVPLFIFFPVFLIWIPETPQFLALIQDHDGLEASLLKFRNKTRKEIQKEAAEITKITAENSQNQGTIRDLLKSRASRKGLIITVTLIVLQQFSGINAVLSYMQLIFDAAGTGISPEISSVVVAIVQLVTIILTSSLVDRLGRRILLFTSFLCAFVALTALGVYFYLKTHEFAVDSLSWLPISSLLVFIVGFNIGLAPIPWTVMAELFPSNIKSTTSTITGFVCFIAAFLITLFFPSVSLIIGMAQSFWVFGGLCLSGAIFIYLVLPETKGRSIQEIQRLLEGIKT